LSDEEKQIFLDIACFFNGIDKNDALHTLNKSTIATTLQISLLEDKSLLTIDKNNKLQVHVLLQAMARYIIKRESSNKTDQVCGNVCLMYHQCMFFWLHYLTAKEAKQTLMKLVC
jgi:hypothetical protein